MQGYPNLFTINPTIPQEVLIKGSTMLFKNRNAFNLKDSDLYCFITNTQFDSEIQNVGLTYTFLYEMHYNINTPGDRKSDRYNIIKSFLQPQIGSGLNQ